MIGGSAAVAWLIFEFSGYLSGRGKVNIVLVFALGRCGVKPRRQVHSGIFIVWVDRFLSSLPSEATCLAMADIHPELLDVEGREFIKDKSWRGANWALTTIENTRYGIPHT